MSRPARLPTRLERVVEPASFEELFLAERVGLYGSLWLVTRNRHEAEEIAQEAFLRVWERWAEVSEMANPAGYLYRTAMNVWRSRLRRARVAVARTFRASGGDDAIALVDARDVVLRALDGLTPRQRAAVVLTELLDLTSEEAGKALGVRPSTVRVLAARGRATLKGAMSDEPSEE